MSQAEAEGLTLLEADNKTGYFGVYVVQRAKTKPYEARVSRGGKQVCLGCFATAKEAALSLLGMRCRAVRAGALAALGLWGFGVGARHLAFFGLAISTIWHLQSRFSCLRRRALSSLSTHALSSLSSLSTRAAARANDGARRTARARRGARRQDGAARARGRDTRHGGPRVAGMARVHLCSSRARLWRQRGACEVRTMECHARRGFSVSARRWRNEGLPAPVAKSPGQLSRTTARF